MKHDDEYESLTATLVEFDPEPADFDLPFFPTDDELDMLADRVDLIDNPLPNLWN